MNHFFDDIQLGSIKLFCLAAELKSFTAAAYAAGVTPAAVSRSIARTEERLGTRLFVRTTRQIRLTDAGQNYYEHCHQAITQLMEAEKKVMNDKHVPSGILRLSVPTPYAHYRLLPILSLFRQNYPSISFEVHISNQNIDFAEGNYDLAVRGNILPDSNLIARKLEDAELIIIASPDYLKQHGKPANLQELAKHECIQFELPSTGRKVPWLFQERGIPIKLNTSGYYTCQEDFLATQILAKSGVGLMQVYRFTVEDELKKGELIEILSEYGGTTRPFMLTYPYSTYIPLKVQVFIDFLMENRTSKNTQK